MNCRPGGPQNKINFSGRELNVIDFTEQYFSKEKTKDRLC